MMHWIIPIVFASTPVEDATLPPVSVPVPAEELKPSEEVDDCQKGVKGLKKDVLGLESYLKDKKDHKDHCPSIKWEQPKLEEYKKEPKSYLPTGCVPETTL